MLNVLPHSSQRAPLGAARSAGMCSQVVAIEPVSRRRMSMGTTLRPGCRGVDVTRLTASELTKRT